MHRWFVQFSGLFALVVGLGGPLPARADTADADFFEKRVRPILAENCFSCHGAKKTRGGLRLDSREALLKGGDTGPAIVPGDPAKSLLIKAVGYQDPELQMPPDNKKLPAQAIADLTTWIKAGAVWPAGTGTKLELFDLAARKKSHWAWSAVQAHEPPQVRDTAWPNDPMDRFILARLETKGIAPAAPVDRRTLLRRVYFDIIGLPPSAAEVEAFVNDASPTALEKVVDRLLASERYGERWGRHWLDLVRYAETRGHEFDYTLPNAFQYRDYMIRALNADVPYNQLVTEHLAGDLMEKPRRNPTQGFNESMLGTGFWFLGEEVHSPVDIRQDQADRFDNRIDVMCKTFLALTVSCARCHDHKFDAISAKDYYSLFSFLESSSYRQVRFDTFEEHRRLAVELTALRDRGRPVVQQALATAARPGVARLGDYLLAAREVIQAPAEEGKALPERVAAIAEQRRLDPGVLGRWVAYLPNAAKDERDPLVAWARFTMDGKNGQRPAEVLRPTLDAWHKQAADTKAALEGASVVVDYATAGADAWMPDGTTFGPRPTRRGDLKLLGDAAHPALSFVDQAAAEHDLAWPKLALAPGVQNEPAVLGAAGIRAGRTIRTPTFTVTTGKVFYLVRGTGRAYIGVAQHAMIDGPLHRGLVRDLAVGDRFQWIAHDLSGYKGLPAHIEFTFNEGADFAVAQVIQAERAPAAVSLPNAALALLEGDAAASVDALAAGYQKSFAAALDQLANDRVADGAPLGNWLLQHGDLLGENVGKSATDAASPFLTEQGRLMAQATAPSRLAPAILDGNGYDEHVFKRGSWAKLGDPAPRRFLEALAGPEPLASPHGSGRLQLARQMTDPTVNPLIARVMVNRIWHHLFGRGIVPTVDNFGEHGDAPTDRELLDYLADRFVRDGWSIKKTIRNLILSRTYQMASRSSDEAERADPENTLWHRTRIRRLEGEAIRDAILSVSGQLREEPFGPPVPVALNEFQDGRGKPASGPLDGNGRRSIYISVHRNFLSSFFLAFDTPIPFSTVGRRSVSNVPAQALILMNDPFVQQQAEKWAKRECDKGAPANDRITSMYLTAFGRPPTDAERDACLAFLDRQANLANTNANNPAVWKDLAHVLFNAKEFIFLN
jgi:cytochrome c553